jgi:hypothetical protein
MGVRTRGLDIKAGAAKLKADRAARLEAELVAPSASTPAAKQKRSKLADTSSQALPTAPISVGAKAIDVVLNLFMALLSFRGISTPSLPAQGGQRRFSYFNIQRGNPVIEREYM